MCAHKVSKKRRIRRKLRFFRQRKRANTNVHSLRGRGCGAQNVIKTLRWHSHTATQIHICVYTRAHTHRQNARECDWCLFKGWGRGLAVCTEYFNYGNTYNMDLYLVPCTLYLLYLYYLYSYTLLSSRMHNNPKRYSY